MTKKIINTDKAPAAIGPYVQAIQAGDTLYVSGQLGIDMKTGELPETVEGQAACSLANLGNILLAAGFASEHVVKTTVFLTDMADFTAVNKIYGEFFKGSFPARACVAVAALPKNARVEVECVACK